MRGLIPVSALTAVLLFASKMFAQGLEDPIPEPIPASDLKLGLESLATDGLVAPTYVTQTDESGPLFVVDQIGVVRTFENGSLQSTPFFDVRDRLINLMPSYDERGLLGLAFHPQFAANGKLYTYTSEPVSQQADFSVPLETGETFDHQSVVSEWRIDSANPNRVDPNSRRELMRIDQPNSNHNAGTIAFGPDGKMYVSLGDGGGADDQQGQVFNGEVTRGRAPGGNGQEPGNIYGTMIRIDPDGNNSANGQYSIPADNPFVGSPDALDEVFAYGLRNPFRFSFDRATGDLLANDTGQLSIEEINRIVAGRNYGWNEKEGTFIFDPLGLGPDEQGVVIANSPGSPTGLIDPVLQYDHDEGIAAIGGFVYRGDDIPQLQGKYIFGDFTQEHMEPAGQIFIADLDTGDIERLDFTGLGFGWYVKGFGEDADGEIYALLGSEMGPSGQGALTRLVIPTPTAAAGGLALLIIGAMRRPRHVQTRLCPAHS